MLVVSATIVQRIFGVLKMVFLTCILDTWAALHQVWDQSLGGNLEPEIKGRIIDIISQMNIFSNFYGVTILQLVSGQSQNLSKTLQNSGKTNSWFDAADNKFIPFRKWIWITLTENRTTSRCIRNNSAISSTQMKATS